jgi:hypothetical protein
MLKIKRIKQERKNRRSHPEKITSKSAGFLLIGFLLFQAFQGSAQKDHYPFVPGETARYGAYFNWHFIWINAGDVLFKCDTIKYEQQKAWRLKAVGKTFKAYDILYTVRDTFESILTYPGFDPLWFRRAVNHGHGHSLHQYTFFPKEGKIISRIQHEDEKPIPGQLTWSKGVHDLLSSAYYFRGYEFEKMKKGQKVNFKMVVDNTSEELYFRYLGTEKVKTRSDREFLCHKVSVWLLEGDFFPEGEYMKVWFTADQNRLPVMVETKILVGSVKAILLNEQKLKYSLTSEIY